MYVCMYSCIPKPPIASTPMATHLSMLLSLLTVLVLGLISIDEAEARTLHAFERDSSLILESSRPSPPSSPFPSLTTEDDGTTTMILQVTKTTTTTIRSPSWKHPTPLLNDRRRRSNGNTRPAQSPPPPPYSPFGPSPCRLVTTHRHTQQTIQNTANCVNTNLMVINDDVLSNIMKA